MNEIIHEDDAEMGILYDIQIYLDNPPPEFVNRIHTQEYIDNIEKQLRKSATISKNQYEVLKQIHERLGLNK
jgi:hypothetical protein